MSVFRTYCAVSVLLWLSLAVSAQMPQKAHNSSKKNTFSNISGVRLNASHTEVRVAAKCVTGTFPQPDWQATDTKIQLVAETPNSGNPALTYRYLTTGGQIRGAGANATWDLAGLKPGIYRANIYVSDSAGLEVCNWVTAQVIAGECNACGTVKVAGPQNLVASGETVQLRLETQNPSPGARSYQWAATPGRIASGQGSPFLTIDTEGLSNQTVRAAVYVSGLAATCPNTIEFAFNVAKKPEPPPIPVAVLFDEFMFTNMDDAKARLDTFVTQIQQAPDASAVITVYGTCAGEASKLAQRQKDYLINQRGLDANRVQVVDGGCRAQVKTELWVVPAGAPPPAVKPSANQCRPCPGKRGF